MVSRARAAPIQRDGASSNHLRVPAGYEQDRVPIRACRMSPDACRSSMAENSGPSLAKWTRTV